MRKYRSLVAWQRARDLSLLVFRAAEAAYHPKSRPILDQLRRAALSIELNLVEGCAQGTGPLFRRHARIAIGSAAEAECLVELARLLGYLPPATTNQMEPILNEVLACLHGLMRRYDTS